MEAFKSAVGGVQKGETSESSVESVCTLLTSKVYNARCNEFLRMVSKLSCIESGKRIDGSVSLRDELKVTVLNT